MRLPRAFGAAVLAVALFTPFSFAQDELNLKLRETPVTEAVKRTAPYVVSVRVPRPNGERDMVGAGVIYDKKNGLIVTNRHVTAGKTQLRIRLNDGSLHDGKVVMTDADLDLAIIRFDAAFKKLDLTNLNFTSGDLILGETIIAIGSPYGYDATVSKGIISAVNREITMPNDVLMTGLIQHDAAINPGNSGGPLINVNGDVIGINVAMRDGAQSIAFAINAGAVNGFIERYYKRQSAVNHGIECEEKIVAQVGDRQRLIVKNAASAELKSGDVIRTIGAVKIANSFDIERALWQAKPGSQVEVKVSREGREVTVRLTLEGAGSAAVVSQGTPPAASVRTANER